MTANEEGEFCGWCRDVEGEGSFCFEGDPDLGPPAGASGCPDSVTIACRPGTYHGPGGGDPADIFECEDNVPCKSDADCTPPYETCTQRNPGAFHDATATNISYDGVRGGDLRVPGSHRGMIAASFCIGSTFTPANDSQGDLPGPAGMALDVEMQLSPSGAFLATGPDLLG